MNKNIIIVGLSALAFLPAAIIGYINRPIELPVENTVQIAPPPPESPPVNLIVLDEVVVKSFRPLPKRRASKSKEPEMVEDCVIQPSLVGGSVRICERVPKK